MYDSRAFTQLVGTLKRLVFLLLVSSVGWAAAPCSTQLITHQSPDLDSAIESMLHIQNELVVARSDAAPAQGFLITRWTAEETREILKFGMLFLAQSEGEVAGYAVVVPGSSLVDSIHPEADHLQGTEAMRDLCSQPYFCRIGVKVARQRDGIGAVLVEAIKAHFPSGVFSLVLQWPHDNTASLRFFERQGFTQVGTLEVASFKDFGHKKSRIVQWP